MAEYTSPSVRKVWIEIMLTQREKRYNTSPSVRKVWIEISMMYRATASCTVTFRKEGVDWNKRECDIIRREGVTFRKEGVDWNALGMYSETELMESPSVRKVWIEIGRPYMETYEYQVTFRKEGVDWNRILSWALEAVYSVTFRKEGVDWNIPPAHIIAQRLVTFRKEGVDWNHGKTNC